MQVQRNSPVPILNFVIAHQAQETQAKAANRRSPSELGPPKHKARTCNRHLQLDSTDNRVSQTASRRRCTSEPALPRRVPHRSFGGQGHGLPHNTVQAETQHSLAPTLRSRAPSPSKRTIRPGCAHHGTKRAGTGAEARPRAHNRIQKGKICSCSKCTTKTVHSSQPTWPRLGRHPNIGQHAPLSLSMPTKLTRIRRLLTQPKLHQVAHQGNSHNSPERCKAQSIPQGCIQTASTSQHNGCTSGAQGFGPVRKARSSQAQSAAFTAALRPGDTPPVVGDGILDALLCASSSPASTCNASTEQFTNPRLASCQQRTTTTTGQAQASRTATIINLNAPINTALRSRAHRLGAPK